ncbi:MAG: DUF262 domain-containing protein [Lachnospiraceae bacterium]|nr:DUF262 domain-containing protein [Lachnospiraceae bacterium]
MTIETIISQIEIGNYALPEFQRGYVWNRDQVRKLMNSLYRGYPIGGLLTWVTPVDTSIMRNGIEEQAYGNVDLILDGQQRITSLYGIIKGQPPAFFEGNEKAFTDLYFNLEDEVFEFYLPLKMKGDNNWINVTQLMKEGAGTFVTKAPDQETQLFYLKNMEKLNKLDNIKKTDIHVQRVVGEDKTIDVVVEIFNNVNSGGTKLSTGDLALAKICAQWPEARSEMRSILNKYSKAGYKFKQDWLLRCVAVYLTHKAYFSELSTVSIADFKIGLKETDKMISLILNQIASRLGLDHDRVLGSRYSIPVMIDYVHNRGEKEIDAKEWDKLLYWYIHTFLWGRYSGSTESTIAQDLNTLATGSGIDGLINQLKQNRGTLKLTESDFWGWSSGARFYPLLYMMTRVTHAKDWGNGLELKASMLGIMSQLDVHHIFPKAVLYKNGYSRSEVNALANYTFLTKGTNIAISDREPKDYFPDYMNKTPGAMETHWIPMDEKLRSVDKYLDFLAERRKLLAESANDFLESLLQGNIEEGIIEDYANRSLEDINEIENEKSEEDTIMEILLWMEEQKLNPGEMYYDLADDTGKQLATIDVAWPDGIQSGLSEPVALLLGAPSEVHQVVNNAGYRYFTDTDSFKSYVESFIH